MTPPTASFIRLNSVAVGAPDFTFNNFSVYWHVPSKRGSSKDMPIIIDNEEYYTVEEACDYLGGITRDTLRRRAEAYGIPKHTRGVTRRVYYLKADLDKLNRPRPVDNDKHLRILQDHRCN